MITIKEKQSPLKRAMKWVAYLTVLVAMGWLGFEYGQVFNQNQQRATEDLIVHLKNDLKRLKATNMELINQNVLFKQSSIIDKEAHGIVKAALAKKQKEILVLKEELAFYTSLIEPSKMKSALHVKDLVIEAIDSDAHLYRYKLILTQRHQNNRMATGKVDIRLTGQYKSGKVTYALSDISSKTKKNIQFKFKYFQSFEGSLRLPSEFQPEFLTILVNPKGKRLKAISKVFQWTDFFTSGEKNVGKS